jgi:hypothetical protein
MGVHPPQQHEPVLDPGSPEHNEVLAAGVELPLDGTEFKL